MSPDHTLNERTQSRHEPEMSIDIFDLLWRHKKFIVGSFMVCVGLAVVYCLLASKKFESTTQILVMKKDANLPINSAAASTGSVDSGMAEDVLATHARSSPALGISVGRWMNITSAACRCCSGSGEGRRNGGGVHYRTARNHAWRVRSCGGRAC
ncbi:MAG: Wzz/FepE/Etk N-terminal domain-containing protein [Pirellulaceae bacterium]